MKTLIRILQISVAVTTLISHVTFAQSVSDENKENRAKFEAAMKVCSEKYGRPERGQRPSDEFIKCMSDQGIKGPPGPPPGGGHGGPKGPPPDSKASQQ